MCYLAVLSARLAALLCIIFSILAVARAGYRFEIHLVRYWNPTHTLNDARTCCEYQHCNECENAFRFCVHERGAERTCGEVNRNVDCSVGFIETRHIRDNDDDITFTDGGSVGTTLTNPLSVTGDLWPREVDICWSVHDLDSSQSINGNSDPVSSRILPVPPLEPGNTTEELHFDTSNAHILLRFRLVCEDPDSVSDCSGPCVPTDDTTGHFTCDPDTGERVCLDGYSDTWSRCIPSSDCSGPCVPTDDTTGHFTCDPDTGERVCLDGYNDTWSRCTVCIPSAGCSPDNGYCLEAWECLCRDGYSGENCTQCQPAAHCNETGGYCTLPGECLCREGYSGEDCGVCNASVTTCEEPSSSVVFSSSHSPVTTSSRTVPSPTASAESPTPSLTEPFFKKSSLLMLSVVGIGLVVLVVVATIVVVALVICGRRRSRRKALDHVHYDIAADKVKIKTDKKNENSDHVYETLDIYTPMPNSRYGISAIGPTYAAVNAMYKVEEDGEVVVVEENAAYDTANGARVDVNKNIAYAALERNQQLRSNSRRTMPLPDLP